MPNAALRVREALAARLAPPQPRELQEWRRADGDKTLRVDYQLGPDSVVLDVGGYEGQWASDIVAMYGCRVLVFEPVPDFAARIARRFRNQPLVSVYPVALAPEAGTAMLSVAGDASSHIRDGSGEQVAAELVNVERVFDKVSRVDLMKLNIEGAEYDLLDKLLDVGLIDRVTDLQVQFHDFVPDARRRRQAIRDRLSRTHRETYCFDFVWENWHLVATRPTAPSPGRATN